MKRIRQIKCHERGRVTIGSSDLNSLSEKEANEFVEAISSLPENEKFLPYRGRSELRFGPFCGVIKTPDIVIELLPKISYNWENLSGLLISLLILDNKLDVIIGNRANLHRQDNHLLEIFIRDFCIQVTNAFLHGVIVRYEERGENLNTIRGRLDLINHFRHNAFNHSRLFCRFDERTMDNPFNRILKSIFRMLLNHTLNPEIRSTLMSLLHRFDNVTDQSYRISDFKSLHFDRTNRQWENIFFRAKQLFSKHYPDVQVPQQKSSEFTDSLAILFNMQDLFENVLKKRIIRDCTDSEKFNFDVQLLDRDDHLATKYPETKGFFGLQPDIILREMEYGEVVAILDAKWKDFNTTERVSNADAYQMNAYADRYKCKNLTLLYPSSEQHERGYIESYQFQTPLKSRLHIVTIDLRDLTSENGMLEGLDKVFSCIR